MFACFCCAFLVLEVLTVGGAVDPLFLCAADCLPAQIGLAVYSAYAEAGSRRRALNALDSAVIGRHARIDGLDLVVIGRADGGCFVCIARLGGAVVVLERSCRLLSGTPSTSPHRQLRSSRFSDVQRRLLS